MSFQLYLQYQICLKALTLIKLASYVGFWLYELSSNQLHRVNRVLVVWSFAQLRYRCNATKIRRFCPVNLLYTYFALFRIVKNV